MTPLFLPEAAFLLHVDCLNPTLPALSLQKGSLLLQTLVHGDRL
jgi:hypothetical protein